MSRPCFLLAVTVLTSSTVSLPQALFAQDEDPWPWSRPWPAQRESLQGLPGVWLNGGLSSEDPDANPLSDWSDFQEAAQQQLQGAGVPLLSVEEVTQAQSFPVLRVRFHVVPFDEDTAWFFVRVTLFQTAIRVASVSDESTGADEDAIDLFGDEPAVNGAATWLKTRTGYLNLNDLDPTWDMRDEFLAILEEFASDWQTANP